MHYRDYARQILEGGSLDDKLLSSKNLDLTEKLEHYSIPVIPGRNKKIQINNEQVKFPRNTSFHLEDKRGLALHFFANHELLAIEMMAAALLVYPDSCRDMIQFKKGLIKTIQDEQKHLKMYIARMKDFGIEFGDFPLNDFFWTWMNKCTTATHFYSAMALTFESANLDFAQFYEKSFRNVEDHKSADMMRIVLEDEITHVALGVHWLNQWRGNKNLWSYYKDNLPGVMTPARSKGIHFDKSIRLKSGFDQDFINQLDNFRDEFSVTNRKGL